MLRRLTWAVMLCVASIVVLLSGCATMYLPAPAGPLEGLLVVDVEFSNVTKRDYYYTKGVFTFVEVKSGVSVEVPCQVPAAIVYVRVPAGSYRLQSTELTQRWDNKPWTWNRRGPAVEVQAGRIALYPEVFSYRQGPRSGPRWRPLTAAEREDNLAMLATSQNYSLWSAQTGAVSIAAAETTAAAPPAAAEQPAQPAAAGPEEKPAQVAAVEPALAAPVAGAPQPSAPRAARPDNVRADWQAQGTITSIFDGVFDKGAHRFRRIAIVPNRLPLVLQEAELWRRQNWQTLADILAGRGFEVIPYDATISAAMDAGLPLEDTFSSEDKFAAFCRISNADLVIMPYYGMYSRTVMMLLVMRIEYVAVVSYQFYEPGGNIFFHRADSSGTAGYLSGLGTLAGIATSAIGLIAGDTQVLPIAGGVIMGVGTVIDLVNAVTPAQKWWTKGFQKAITSAIQPFLAVYGR